MNEFIGESTRTANRHNQSRSENEGEAAFNAGVREHFDWGMGVFNRTHAAFEGRATGLPLAADSPSPGGEGRGEGGPTALLSTPLRRWTERPPSP